MDDLETRLRTAFRARAANAPRELHRDLPQGHKSSRTPGRRANRRWRGPITVAVASALVVLVATALLARGSSDSDKPGWSSDGITLNTSSWTPTGEGQSWMEAGVGGIVRIDADGCVYLEGKTPDVVQDVVWPAGYTAARQPDGTVNISDPNGVVVAATGHRLRAGGGEDLLDSELACQAQGSNYGTVMITDELPPLSDD
jgi:hypothetical protein